ncbi:recombinase family protein [Streptomyces sp. NPDC004393]
MDHPQVTVEFVFDRLGAVELAAAYQILVPVRGRAIRQANGVMAMIHAALYARVSSARQQQHETIDSQVACLREHARMQGWEIPQEWVFADDGWSGSTLVRPALERLRDLSAQRLVERVLCLAPDRLARSYAHQVLLVEEFTKNGTELVFIRHPEVDTPEQALMVQVQGVIAEYERAQIAERTRRGKLHRARLGQASVLGRAPYGYRYLSRAEHGAAAYVVDQAEAAVARIFHRYAAGGISMRALARELSAEKIPSPQGRPEWDAGTLGRMLRNPAYAGRACFGKTQTAPDPPRPNRTSRQAGRVVSAQAGVIARPREEWIEIPVPALVSEEVFALVERRLAQNAKFSPRNTKEPALLQGLLVCDLCGYAYTRTSQGPGLKKYHYYRCPGTNGWELPGGRRVCSSRPLRADGLDDLVWEHVIALLANPALVRAELDRRLERMRDADPVRAHQERLHRQIATVDAAISRLISAYQEDLITRNELRAQRQNLHGQLEALAAQLVDQQAYLRLAENLEGFLARLGESTRTTSVLDRQRVLRGGQGSPHRRRQDHHQALGPVHQFRPDPGLPIAMRSCSSPKRATGPREPTAPAKQQAPRPYHCPLGQTGPEPGNRWSGPFPSGWYPAADRVTSQQVRDRRE